MAATRPPGSAPSCCRSAGSRSRSSAAPQTAEQDYDLGWEVWALLVFATLGPLVLTNMLWFAALHRIGASRATLVANLQPFVAAVFALVLLSEQMTLLQVARRRPDRRRDPARAPAPYRPRRASE